MSPLLEGQRVKQSGQITCRQVTEQGRVCSGGELLEDKNLPVSIENTEQQMLRYECSLQK